MKLALVLCYFHSSRKTFCTGTSHSLLLIRFKLPAQSYIKYIFDQLDNVSKRMYNDINFQHSYLSQINIRQTVFWYMFWEQTQKVKSYLYDKCFEFCRMITILHLSSTCRNFTLHYHCDNVAILHQWIYFGIFYASICHRERWVMNDHYMVDYSLSDYKIHL